ncbi:hypothetical protein Tco_1324486 [Tanacetum coccineum]
MTPLRCQLVEPETGITTNLQLRNTKLTMEIWTEKNKRYKSSGNSSSFNTSQSQAASFNLNTQAGDDKDEEEDVREVRQPIGRDIAKKKGEASTTSSTSCNEDALVNEFRSHPNLQG